MSSSGAVLDSAASRSAISRDQVVTERYEAGGTDRTCGGSLGHSGHDDEGRWALSLDVKLHAAQSGPRDVHSDLRTVGDEQTLVRHRDRPFDEWRMAAKLLAGREDSGDGIERSCVMKTSWRTARRDRHRSIRRV